MTARIEHRDLGSTVREIQRTLGSKLVLPKGVSIAYGGTYQTQQESFRGLAMVLLTAVLFVFIVLLFQFESLRVPLTVFAINLPSLLTVTMNTSGGPKRVETYNSERPSPDQRGDW